MIFTLIAFALPSSVFAYGAVCGDGICQSGETSATCPQDCGSSGGGGGGGSSPSIAPPSDSNTITSSISSSFTQLVTGDKTYSRPIQVSSSIITAIKSEDLKTAELTGEEGTIVMKPNKESDISMTIPSETTVESTMDWDGKISPPLISSITKISKLGGVIEGATKKLMRDSVLAVIKAGSTKASLKFNNKISLTIPMEGTADGTVVTVYNSADAKKWRFLGTATVKDGKVVIETDTLSYFAFEEDGETPIEKTGFNDISNHWAESYINQIADMGIVSGKSEGKYAPDDVITRAELTKIAVNAFGFSVPDSAEEAPFFDVDKNAWYAPYIKVAKDNGIVEGWADGNFSPNAPISRAAALKIMIEAAGFGDVEGNYQNNYATKAGFSYVFFPDVNLGQWYSKYVAYAKDFDIVSGYGDGEFKPGNNITRAEVAKIVLKVLDLQ